MVQSNADAAPVAEVPFTYAAPEHGRLKRLVIRAVERITGQPRLKRLYMENQRQPLAGEGFWDAAVRLLRLEIRIGGAGLAAIPRSGPVVVLANHPFGVLDGIVIAHLVAQVRDDFKVLTNSVLYRAPEARPNLLPIDFAETRQARDTNLRSRAAAHDLLRAGGCLVVFPGGTVSTVTGLLKRRAFDPVWKPFAGQLIRKSAATVVPVFFAGQNSRLFQLASHLSMTLRLALLFKEVARRIGTPLPVVIGDAIPAPALAGFADATALVQHLREQTYALGGVRAPGELKRLAGWRADGGVRAPYAKASSAANRRSTSSTRPNR